MHYIWDGLCYKSGKVPSMQTSNESNVTRNMITINVKTLACRPPNVTIQDRENTLLFYFMLSTDTVIIKCE